MNAKQFSIVAATLVSLATFTSELRADEHEAEVSGDSEAHPEAEHHEHERPQGWFDRLSFDLYIDASAGASSADDHELEELQRGGHDPRKRGFNLTNVELYARADVHRHLEAEVALVTLISPEGESIFELEEAFLRSRDLPHGFGVEAGFFYTEFGVHNPQHPHLWRFLDQPLVASRFFGGDGLRSPGVSFSWRHEVSSSTTLTIYAGAQNAGGETLASFKGGFADHHAEEGHEDEHEDGEEEAGPGIDGRPFVERDTSSFADLLWHGRVLLSNEDLLGEWSRARLGASVVIGPNATGPDADTLIAGMDLSLTWYLDDTSREHAGHSSHVPRARFVELQGEVMLRRYGAAAFADAGDPLDPADDVNLSAEDYDDWGFYSQVIYGFNDDWAAGLRLEAAGGSGGAAPSSDALRDDRTRISALVQWAPMEEFRLRTQLNVDNADHLADSDAWSVWLGASLLLGTGHGH